MTITSSSVVPTTSGAVPGRQKAGFILSIIINVLNLPSIFQSAPDGETGPPFGVMLLCTVLAVIGLVATVVAWRQRSALANRIAAGCLIVSALSGVPAFFVDVPMAIKVLVAFGVVITVVAVALMFSGRRTTT